MRTLTVAFFLFLFHSNLHLTFASNGLFMTYDFKSSWITLSTTNSGTATTTVNHGLGEVPLLVDVMVKATDGSNNQYIFPATGIQIRDDDDNIPWGGATYRYDDTAVYVSVPHPSNGLLGKAVIVENNDYWYGPNSQTSTSAQIQVRAWKASSLPSPDYTQTGISVTARGSISETYVERFHGLGEYPSLTIARIVDPNTGMYYDTIGANVFTQTQQYQRNGYSIFGFSDIKMRFWAASDTYGCLYAGGDGIGWSVSLLSGTLEIYAWKENKLMPNVSTTYDIASATSGFSKSLSALNSDVEETLTRAWAQSSSGANSGLRFAGSGTYAYKTSMTINPCSYGGLTYAYTSTNMRFWKPKETHGSLICIGDNMGNGVNSQGSKDGIAVIHKWALDVNECLTGVCKNGATCTNYAWGYTCDCVAGWTGTDCNTDIDECAGNPCYNGATCNNMLNYYTCTCASGWTSMNCDANIDECASNPCQNGATCNNLLDMYNCTCVSGYVDYNCQTDFDECASSPCFNGATCNDIVNGYTCTCSSGFTGTLCDAEIKECDSSPCQNGAACVDGPGIYVCRCPQGWSGVTCSTDVDECILYSPCLNSGTCTNSAGSYECACASGYAGDACEQPVSEANLQTLSKLGVFVPLLTTLLLHTV